MKNSNFSDLSIKQKVQTIFAIAISLCLIIFSVFCYSFYHVKMTRTFTEKNIEKLNSAEREFSSAVENVNNMSKLLMVNDTVVRYLRDETDVRASQVQSEIYNMLNSFSGHYSVFIFKNDKTYVNTAIGVVKPNMQRIFQNDWYGYVSSLNGGYALIPNTSAAFTLNTNTNIISFARIINDMNTQKPLGMLVINIPADILEYTYTSSPDSSSSIAYLDSKGNPIYSDMTSENLTASVMYSYNMKDDTFTEVRNSMIFSGRQVTDTGITIICQSQIQFMYGSEKELFIGTIFLFLVILFMMLIINIYINKFITTPITKMSEGIGAHSGKCPEPLKTKTNDDEIGRLKEQYNEMVERINKLLDEVVEKEKQRRKAEIKVIQEQIKPHFLYNTLETIGYMALQNSREEVYDVVETLGNFYRKFLSKGNETITIKDEVAIVRDYIKLLRLRYDDMFEDSYDIQEDLLSVPILKLILQPLVENSIYHGIRPKGEVGMIKISIFSSENKYIHIIVYDSGIGMNEEQIKQLISGENKKSFGFKGTMDRIKNFYPADESKINIRSKEGEFCEIEIIIPYEFYKIY